VPHDLGFNVSKLWANDPKLRHFLIPKQPPINTEQKQELAIKGPKSPPVKGANEASLNTSSTVAALPLPRDPEDGGSFVGGKRSRTAESFSALQGRNNAFVEKEPKRQSVRTGAPAPGFGQLVPFSEADQEETKEVIEFSAGFKEMMRQDSVDPEFKMQRDDDSGQMVIFNDGEPSSKVTASTPAGRTNKASFQKDQGTSDRQIRAIAASKKSRTTKANAGRQPVDFVQAIYITFTRYYPIYNAVTLPCAVCFLRYLH
jgi:hypothetical protein